MRSFLRPVPPGRLSVALVAAPLVAFTVAGCTPTYAPPVRAVQYGAPGRVHQGEVEIGGTMAGVFAPTGGSLHVAVGLRDWVSMEGGGTVIVPPAGPDASPIITGWAGARFTLPRRRTGVSLLLDGELGLGGGAGGELCSTNPQGNTVCNTDGLTGLQRRAFGGYEGGGLGLGYKWFSFYGRARIEESGATDIPVTYWPSVSLGLGFDMTRRVSLDVGGGYLGYFDAKNAQGGWFYQTGLSVRFGRGRAD
jgi:hypothetical protein